MAFEYRFNVIRFYSKLNRFVLSPRKKPNHFVLKIRPGGFADYTFMASLKNFRPSVGSYQFFIIMD